MDRAATKPKARLAAQGGREAKLQRLNSLRRDCPYASKSALQAILSNVKTNGLPDLMSSKNMTEATRAQLCKNNLYGPLMQQVHAVARQCSCGWSMGFPYWQHHLLKAGLGLPCFRPRMEATQAPIPGRGTWSYTQMKLSQAIA